MSVAAAAEKRTQGAALALAAIAVGLIAGAGAAALDFKVFAGIAMGLGFIVALWYVWLDPKIGLYLAVVTASLDTLGKLPFSDTVPVTLYQIAIAVTLVSLLRAHSLGKRTFAWKRTPADLPIMLYLALAFLTLGFAPNLRVSLITFGSLVSSVVLFYLVLALLDTPEEARRLLLWFFIVAAFLGGLAIVERVTGVSIAGNVTKTYITGIRVRGSFKDPNMLGMMMMMALAAGIPLAMGEDKQTRRLLALGAPLVAGALLLSFSRGAWIAAVVAISVVVLAYPGEKRRKRIVPLILCLVLAAGIGLSLLPPEFISKRIVQVSTDNSFMARVYMAQAGFDILKSNPVGVGLAGFPYKYPAFRVGDVRPSLVQSHMAYLTILVEMGIPGLALFLWLIWRFFAAVVPDIIGKRDDLAARVQLAAAGAVLGILVQAWTYSVELSKQLWFALGLLMAAHLLVRRGKEADWRKETK